jgi:hypothetical protein
MEERWQMLVEELDHTERQCTKSCKLNENPMTGYGERKKQTHRE